MTAFSKNAVAYKVSARFGLLSFVSAGVMAMASSVALGGGLDKLPPPEPAVKNPIVVELFTSQGCVSCPPADEFFATLADDPRLLPLSLHVDYWDYIGWQDNFAKAEFTERQKRYARAIGSRTIYTPQFIVSGQDRIEGFVPERAFGAIETAAQYISPIELRAERKGEQLTIHALATQTLSEPLRVQLVRYVPHQTVLIERGENAGKTVTYRNIVTNWTLLGDWHTAEPLEVDVPILGSDPAAVVIQRIGPSQILSAAVVQELED